MSADEYVIKTLEELKGKLKVKLSEAYKILSVINSLEDEYDFPKSTLDNFSERQLDRTGESQANHLSAPLRSGRPDEYLGLKPIVAAKQYLKKVRRASPVDEIVKAIQAGGAAISGNNWQEELSKSLLRSTVDVIKVQEGVFGLVEFYSDEQIKGIRDSRRRTT